MSDKITFESIAPDALPVVTGGFVGPRFSDRLFARIDRWFGRIDRVELWASAMRSGKLSGPGSTLEFLQNPATRGW